MQTISEVTKNYPVSTRMLRYYEQIGLLKSVKKEGYAYRTYEESSLVRLEQILVLRKLRIPLKEIQRILQSDESRIALAVFQEKIYELSSEMTALSVIHNVLQNLVDQLKLHAEVKLNPGVWMDKTLLQIVEALPLSKSNLKEDLSMNDLIKADQHLSTLKDVRIVYLPPSPVASIQVIGKLPEYETGMSCKSL
ncbi:MerR family transcriptional regulator [Paenibacillus sp. FSL P2-0136]|uniref:MerR family transcriptional regulator n=1 Tax=unclassified Paenibacillus TaxID=185978 RepID=UPI0030DB0BE8